MAIEQQFALQLDFTNQLIVLIKALINFEGVYSDIALLRRTKVIQAKANQKIANDSRLNKLPLTQLADSLRKHIEFIRVLVPTYEVERIPLKLDGDIYGAIIAKMMELYIAKSSDSCMFAKKTNDRDIKCEDILKGTYTDLELTDRLNALGDLTNITGSGRDKNESTLGNLIHYLGLSDFDSEKSPDVDTVQFYFTHDIRISMNDVLCSFIRYVSHLYNIAVTVELQLRSLFTSTDGSTQNKLTLANDELRKSYAGDLLQEKFSALKDQLKKIAPFDNLISTSVKDETNSYMAMIENSLTIALASCDKWFKNLEIRYPKLTTKDTDENMANMLTILINFTTQIHVFKRIFGTLNLKISDIFKSAEALKTATEEAAKRQIEKETSRPDKRSGSTTSPPRGLSLSLFGSTPTPPPATVPPQRPPSRPDTSPHPGRSTTSAAVSSDSAAAATAPSKKSGSGITRPSSNYAPAAASSSSASPQLVSHTPPIASPPPNTQGGKP